MPQTSKMVARLGNEDPLFADGRRAPPDRREVSARWLAGTFLTGITSIVLMGVALSAALDGRQQLTTPAELLEANALDASPAPTGEVGKEDRLSQTIIANKAKDRRVMELSTVQRVGDRDVIRTAPFAHLTMALGAGHTTKKSYPSFDALDVFAEDAAVARANATTGQIYGAKVESEVSLKVSEFPVKSAEFAPDGELSTDAVEEYVRITGAALTEGDVQVASLEYVDPLRFGMSDNALDIPATYGVRFVPENVTVAQKSEDLKDVVEFAEELISFRADRKISSALEDAGYSGSDAKGMTEAISTLLNGNSLRAGSLLRLGIETVNDVPKIMRAGVYRNKEHVLTVALDDNDQYVPADPPEGGDQLIAALDVEQRNVRVRGDLPSVYDGVYRAAYAYDMTPDLTKQLVKMLAAEVDYQARLAPSDELEVFMSLPEGAEKPDETSEILYVRSRFGGNERKFYRHKFKDGSVEFFDSDGKSAKQFLLRNPVPNGNFRSGFGMRRHPILGYMRLHAGVDWSAPRGTPIIASGSGIVEKADWTSGYGKQTIIKHANGYETSYSHQNAFAKGISEGARVRQGQVIGYVGSTGLSTGPHLHYEMIVNGNKVDAMRIRLPVGKTLKGGDMTAFKRERDRIDALLVNEGEPQKVASVAN
jgi:murein DD-endopeptidase MepM/ murein hydrolase activator NlpD